MLGFLFYAYGISAMGQVHTVLYPVSCVLATLYVRSMRSVRAAASRG
jgi:hypothetical protein